MIKVGDNVMDGRTVVVSVNEDGATRVEFPFWRSPIDDKAFAVTYAPATTAAFIEAQVLAALRGEVPPFVGI